MRHGRLLILLALAGLVVFALSFVDGWIVLDREVRGEGFRRLVLHLDAWRLAAVPVLTAGVVAAFVTGAAAAILAVRGRRLGRIALAAGSVVALALIAASLVPIGVDRHATSVDISGGPMGWVGAGLAAIMVVGAWLLAGPRGAAAVALGLTGLVALGVGTGARRLSLELQAGTGEHWSDGAYARIDGGRQTLTIGDGRFRIDDRWSGTWESSGWTVVLADDPACPDARGTYHAHGEGELGEDLRFVKVVDTCGDGARAADLEGGLWLREP
jgi:hypothetical protein